MSGQSDWKEGAQPPLMTSCKQAARLVSISFERKLSFRELLAMRLHLLMCKTCSYYKKQITALRGILTRNEEALDKIPPSSCDCLDPQAKKRMTELLKRKG